MIKYITILFVLITLPAFAVEIDNPCPGDLKNIPASTPASQFTYTPTSSMVTDNKTGLIWARCPWGYVWSENGGCRVDDSVMLESASWSDALDITQTASENGYLGETGWRLPNIKELSSIAEVQCARSAMNQIIFGANNTAGKYWSNSHVFEQNDIWVTNFYTGAVTSALPNNELKFRLVKNAP